MNITTKSKYALRAMTLLARSRNGSVKREVLASAQGGISMVYLEKILLRLREKKLVTAKSGPGGGYRLARPSSLITAWDIISAVEESPEPVRCLGSKSSPCETECEVKDFWGRVWGAAVNEMKQCTIQSLAAGQIGDERFNELFKGSSISQCR